MSPSCVALSSSQFRCSWQHRPDLTTQPGIHGPTSYLQRASQSLSGGQYSFLKAKSDPRVVPANLDFCLANLNCEASSASPPESLSPTALLGIVDGVITSY